ncbi:MAG TPA: hypothetical protein VJH97_00780 [Candidatus Nanoarchaeia archaeon]|nr:hypothetical protein [Candidatus Nanoarchaeia archaeon]
MKKLLTILFLALVLIYSAAALTASIGTGRMILRVEVEDGTPLVINREIIVHNSNNVSVKILLEPDALLQKIMEMKDNDFILAPGESKDARFTLTLNSGGVYDGKVLVRFLPVNETSGDASAGLVSNIVVIANGTITDEYYEITTIDEPVDDLGASSYQPEGGIVTDDVDSNQSVSLTLGGDRTSAQNPFESIASPIIGFLIIVVFVAIGASVYILIAKKKK